MEPGQSKDRRDFNKLLRILFFHRKITKILENIKYVINLYFKYSPENIIECFTKVPDAQSADQIALIETIFLANVAKAFV
jgi:hypothetical protein